MDSRVLSEGVSAEEDLWARFLENAIGGLREAARRIGCTDLRPHYEARNGWFGKARKGHGGSRIPKEEAISQALVEVLKKIRSEQIIEGWPGVGIDLTKMEFQSEVPRRVDDSIGPKAQPTDIMIAIVHDEIDFRIEAKSVLNSSDVSGEYLGECGLGRFDDVRSPYTTERFGGMLAYVVNEDAVRWQTRIGQALRNAQPPLTVLITTIAGEVLTTTTHDREIDNPLHRFKERCRTDVIHLVLEFEASPSLRRP